MDMEDLETLTMSELLSRQKKEFTELLAENKSLLKAKNGKARIEIEAQNLQREMDMKSHHNDQKEQLEEYLQSKGISIDDPVEEPSEVTSKGTVESKKAKAQKKKEKKANKAAEKMEAKELLRATGPSARELELSHLNEQLKPLSLQVKDVEADGNCLYRAIAHQIPGQDYLSLKRLASEHMRSHCDEFAPFIGVESSSKEFEDYCHKVASPSSAEWGGQIELQALSQALDRSIAIHSADVPVLHMGGEKDDPIRITYHRHYYTLGEHYNSVERVKEAS